MNSDATEAALGLLGLSPLNAPQPHPHPHPHPHQHVVHPHGPSLTSSSVGIAVDRTSTPPIIIQSALPPSLVPLKRKQPSPALPSATTTSLTPNFPRDASSAKARQPSHPLATSSTTPISLHRQLPSVSTKSSTTTSQRQPQPRPFSPILTGPVPPQTPPTTQLSLASPSTSQHPPSLVDVPPPPDADAISCICGLTYDDGFSIACDDCSRWCHAACFGIVQGEVPEFWKCWVCDPALEVDKERAIKTQKGRLKAMRMKASHGVNGTPAATGVNGIGGSSAVDEGGGGAVKPASRRKTSPGGERKSRRGSAVAAAIEGSGSSRKKRRASMLSPANPSSPSIPSTNHASTQPHAGSSHISFPNGNGPSPPTNLPPTPVTFPPDIYPNPAVYAQLLRVAKAWRGVTALSPPSPQPNPPKAYNDGRFTKVESKGYQDRYGYSMCPRDNATPVIMDENGGDAYLPRTVLRTDPFLSCSNPHPGLNSQHLPTCTPAHLRPPSPRLHVASDPSPFPHTSVYPSPAMSNYMSTPVPSSSYPRSYAKSPLAPSTNTISSSSPNDKIPATTLLAPYTASIVPSAAYLADPLNGYAHLGMGKPQVRLVGGGWEVGLDARGVGGVPDPPDASDKGNGTSVAREDVAECKARWARCGCWPNAVVRPVICSGKLGAKNEKGKGLRHRAECAKASSDGSTVSEPGGPSPTVDGTSAPPPVSRMQAQQMDESSDQDDAPSASDSDADPTTLSFALFALRDLRADEEIVLGWEWDDGHAVHMLPALMESPGMFAPAYLHHLRAQFTSILHALSSTFTTCACGSSTRDCAVRVMERVVEGRWPWPGGEMTSEASDGDASDVNCASEEWDDGEIDVEGDGNSDSRHCGNLGLGMNVDVDIEMDAPTEVDGRIRRVKKRKVRKKSQAGDPTHVNGSNNASIAGSLQKSKGKKPIDLGPLVGLKRGFRTREKSPMNGGWGGVEIVPSSLAPCPEARAEEEDPHVGSKGKGKVWVADDTDDTDADPSLTTLPPRMRKAWPRPPTNQPELPQENLSRDHSTRAASWKVHEGWRSPPDTISESPTSVSGAAEGGGSGKGGDQKQSSASLSGDGEDGADGHDTEFDTETEADGLDDTRQMPPPPMPASLDPTTVSSLAHAVRSTSPRASVTRTPPQTTTSTSTLSDRSGQPPSHGPSALPAPPNTIVHSLGPQVNHDALSPSTSFPPAVQAPGQSLPPPSVSPSATFSKLSLHSPDASSTSHLSVLASTQRISDHRALSPPHRPSKPLHVHPQNEPPSFHPSLSAPVVTLSSPDGTRDTPAETQYQQPYRSSPDARHDPHPLSDMEKRRPTNGETHRVRFASPEILNGLPQLRTRASSDSLELLDDHDSVSTGASRTVQEQEFAPLARDAMDVEVDVVGDNQEEDVCGTSHMTEDEYPSGVVEPSLPQAPPDSRPYWPLSEEGGAAPENDTSGIAPGVNETLQVESMMVDPAPTQPVQEPSTPAPPKVKMSLKDFALRKKKQREEEMAAKALGSPDGAALPPSPSVDIKREFTSEHAGTVQTVSSGDSVNGQDVKMDDATKEHASEPLGALRVDANGLNDGSSHPQDDTRDPRRTEEISAAEDTTRSTETQALSTVVTTKADTLQPSLQDPAHSSSRVLGEKSDTDQTQMQIDQPTTTLTAKMEIMDVVVPSGLVGADDRTPDVVSFAPDPPPPPLTTKQTSETTTIDRTGAVSSISRPASASITVSTSTPTPMSTSASTSAVNSRSNSVGIPGPLPPALVASAPSSIPSSRRPSQEDGEITNSTPPKTYLPRSHTPPTQPRSFHAAHPSSPNLGTTSTSSTPVPRRPAPPLSRSPLSNGTAPTPVPISSRPLPSGPRALRGSMTQPTHSYVPPPRPPYTGSQYIPRGPSADRDRMDWERGDRQWTAQARSRSRAGSNGWGR